MSLANGWLDDAVEMRERDLRTQAFLEQVEQERQEQEQAETADAVQDRDDRRRRLLVVSAVRNVTEIHIANYRPPFFWASLTASDIWNTSLVTLSYKTRGLADFVTCSNILCVGAPDLGESAPIGLLGAFPKPTHFNRYIKFLHKA
jgi:hypothetical protein